MCFLQFGKSAFHSDEHQALRNPQQVTFG